DLRVVVAFAPFVLEARGEILFAVAVPHVPLICIGGGGQVPVGLARVVEVETRGAPRAKLEAGVVRVDARAAVLAYRDAHRAVARNVYAVLARALGGDGRARRVNF